jgi:hypothetical protein
MKQIAINNLDDLLLFIEQVESIEVLQKAIQSALKTNYITIGEFTLQEYKDATKEHILTYWKDRAEFEKPLFILMPNDFLPNIKNTYLNNN